MSIKFYHLDKTWLNYCDILYNLWRLKLKIIKNIHTTKTGSYIIVHLTFLHPSQKKKIHNIITLPRRYRTTFIIVSCCSLSYDWSIVFTRLCYKCCYKLYYTKNRKSINLSKDFQIEFHYKMPAFGMCDIVATQ